jgi:hypothetical protein
VGRTAAGASLTEMASGAGVLGTDGARRGGAARGRAVGEERWGDSRRVMDRIWVCVQPLFRTGLCLNCPGCGITFRRPDGRFLSSVSFYKSRHKD